MKVVLEHIDTKRFFAKEEQWVKELEQVLCFASSVDAEEFARKEKLTDVVILIKSYVGNEIRLRCNH